MSKFKISLKVTGLELTVEGSRDDVPLMTEAMTQQFAGLFSPASGIVEGQIVDEEPVQLPPSTPSQPPKLRKRRPSPRRSQRTGEAQANSTEKAGTVDWKHDPSKWGSPQQGWSTVDKAIWLLYVVAKEKDISELAGFRIAKTFNKHFRQSGPIHRTNVNRDLGKAKGRTPPLVAEDTTQTPSEWFLTQAGERRAEELIGQALGRAPDTNGSSGE